MLGNKVTFEKSNKALFLTQIKMPS